MDLIEVDVVEPESLERRVDRGQDVLAGESATVLARHGLHAYLGREHVLLARAEELREQAPGQHLALAAVVDVRRVEEGDASLDGGADDRLRLVLPDGPRSALVLAEAHHPEADARHAQACPPEVDVVHAEQPSQPVAGGAAVCVLGADALFSRESRSKSTHAKTTPIA